MRTVSFFVFLFVSFVSNAQDAVLFKLRYEPRSAYVTEMKMTGTTTIDYDGSPEVIASIRSSGMTFPMIVQSETSVKFTGVTDEKKNGILPVIIKYDQMNSKSVVSGQEMKNDLPVNDLLIRAHYDGDGRMIIDAVEGSLPEEAKEALRKTASSVGQQIDFPKTPVKRGETFTSYTPMNLPIPGSAADMKIRTDYTLRDVKAGTAYFDFIMNLDFDIKAGEGNFKSNGKGVGKMEFDIAKGMMTKSTSDMTFDFEMPVQEVGLMKGNASMKNELTVSLQKG